MNLEPLWQLLRLWTPLGQGCFLVLVLALVLAFTTLALYGAGLLVLALARGWPPPPETRP